MGNSNTSGQWAGRERLLFIERVAWWRGAVNRGDLREVYGISAAQASADLQAYQERNPGALAYNLKTKRYESRLEMQCVLHEPRLEEAVGMFLGAAAGIGGNAADAGDKRVAVLALPERRIDPGIARRVLMALLEQRRLRVRYVSVNSGTEEWRDLTPGGLGWDGRRWHVRAWCAEREDWRDFVLGRMSAAEWPGAVSGGLPPDVEWETMETVKLRINPELAAEKREALRMDYGLAGDELEIRVRRSMRSYLLANMFIDDESHRDLPHHFALAE